MILSEDQATQRKSLEFVPGKLWSLWDVINYQLMPLVMLLKFLGEEITTLEDKIRVRDFYRLAKERDPSFSEEPPLHTFSVTDADFARVNSILELAGQVVKSMILSRTDDRVGRFKVFMREKYRKIEDLLAQLKALLDALEDDCRYKRLHLYGDDVGMLLLRVESDWSPAYQAFPSVTRDIQAATDCYALGNFNGSIFHLMQIAEIGLRALGKERKITLKNDRLIEWAEWGDILKGLEDARKEITFNAKAGPNKDRALSFYSGSIGHLQAFKDQYRNAVSHVRKQYAQWEAQIALNHGRDFMNGLPPLLTEGTDHPIDWGL